MDALRLLVLPSFIDSGLMLRGGGFSLSPSIRRKISTNRARGTATSAICEMRTQAPRERAEVSFGSRTAA
jgi:hypothetical protein